MQDLIKDKVILVTGGTGTIGSRLVTEILKLSPKQVRVFSRDEGRQHDLLQLTGHPANLRLFIGDVRDFPRLKRAFAGVDIVFHAAAMKYVPLCEYNPFEAVKTNILGSQNVIDAALACGVKKVVAVSTDKVVNPVGVMGTSKLMMEKLFINANYYKGDADTHFSCVRFGNVTWARGSVLPLWKKQAEETGSITVTDPEMTRFLMSQAEAVGLVLEALRQMKGGEIFVFKMAAVKVVDLVKIFSEKYCAGKKVEIKTAGKRAGEKIHEELLGSALGSARVFENERMFIICPELNIYGFEVYGKPDYPKFTIKTLGDVYSSQDHLDPEKIKEIV